MEDVRLTGERPEAGWAATYGGTCYPADCDHMGHMNVAAYVRKFDEATWMLRDRLDLTAAGMEETGLGIAAMESNIAYTREVFPGEAIAVCSCVIEVGNKTARFRHEMRVAKSEGAVLAARCTYLVCCYARSAHKGTPWSQDLRAALDAWSIKTPPDQKEEYV